MPNDEFERIYDAVYAEVLSNVTRQGGTAESVTLEPTRVAAHCFMDVPYNELLKIKDVDEFITACGSKIWDRLLARPQHLALRRDLESGISREELMARMTETYNQSAVVARPL